jgi:hypothetical protein
LQAAKVLQVSADGLQVPAGGAFGRNPPFSNKLTIAFLVLFLCCCLLSAGHFLIIALIGQMTFPSIG